MNHSSFLTRPETHAIDSTKDPDLLDQVLEDFSFILRSETKRFGAKCIAHMLPEFTGTYSTVPDFCPDSESFNRQKTATTPLLSPIILRMVLCAVLFTDFLPPMEQLFERSKELPLFILLSLNLLLTHASHAMAKTVNMFTTAASKRLDAGQSTSRRRKRSGQGAKQTLSGDAPLEGVDAQEINPPLDNNSNDDDAANEEANEPVDRREAAEAAAAPADGNGSNEDVAVESDTSGEVVRGPRLRRLRPRRRPGKEDDFFCSSLSDYDDDEEEEEEGSEYSEDEDDYDDDEVEEDEEDWSSLEEEYGDNVRPVDSELNSQNSESPLSGGEDEELAETSLQADSIRQGQSPIPEEDAQSPPESEHADSTQDDNKTPPSARASTKADDDSDRNEDTKAESDESEVLQEYTWVRLFVAAHFVDGLLAAVKLLTDWLALSRDFLPQATASRAALVQQAVCRLAGLLNYLSPIVAQVEREFSDAELLACDYVGLPSDGVRSPSQLMPHLSAQCREALRRELQQGGDTSRRTPLPEDWLLRGTPSLSALHASLDFDQGTLSSRIEEALLRCLVLVRFGRRFAQQTPELGVNFVYHAESNYFTAPPPTDSTKTFSRSHQKRSDGPVPRKYRPRKAKKEREPYRPKVQPPKIVNEEALVGLGDLPTLPEAEKPSTSTSAMREEAMRNMAKLRLKNQVDKLSEEMDKRASVSVRPVAGFGGQLEAKFQPSPYIVLDTFCLLGHMPFVKCLLSTQQYVILIPRAVIAHLDLLKKTTVTARAVIRFLEEQTHIGNRYLRIQTEDEDLPESQKIRLNKIQSTTSGDDAAATPLPDFAVTSRWIGIVECAAFFSKVEPGSLASKNSEPSASKASTEIVNLLKYRPPASEVVPTPIITVLIGSRITTPQDVSVPLQLVHFAQNSGFSP
uniref:PINc domain-containing protein n=1 Tax=Mesocestoides corti TaxID=53468 RepID=A0A5K3FM20_MESCO